MDLKDLETYVTNAGEEDDAIAEGDGETDDDVLSEGAEGFGDNAYVQLYDFSSDGDDNIGGDESQLGLDELATVADLSVRPLGPNVPEPGTLPLVVAGLLGLVSRARTRS